MANETLEDAILANETVALAVDLLKRRSLTPDDAGCHDLIAARLAPLGDEGGARRACRHVGGGGYAASRSSSPIRWRTASLPYIETTLSESRINSCRSFIVDSGQSSVPCEFRSFKQVPQASISPPASTNDCIICFTLNGSAARLSHSTPLANKKALT